MAKHLEEPYESQPRAPIWRTKVALSAVLMLIVVIATFFGFRWLITDQPAAQDTTLAVDNDDVQPFDQDTGTGDEDEAQPEPTDQLLIVHVAGEVQQPGIVELSQDARVIDAIEAAGGPTQQAQLHTLNLAAKANDGDYILVPDPEAGDVPLGDVPGAEAGPAGSHDATAGTVNLNSADAAALETLPGIGPATAEQIIAHREQHGDFADLASLEEVSGIGPATRERLDGLVSW